MMRRLCVFCGSSSGSRSNYADAANRLARVMFERGIGLVYGGGGIGIMGAIANAMLACGGEVIGVIPWSLLQREEGHRGLTELHIVDTMHERKALMAELADGFVALPGGIGTLEEFFEIWTWAQLGIHAKPCGLLNESGYFTPLLRFLDHAVEEQFVSESHRAMVIIESDPEVLLQRLASYCPANVPRWLSRDET
jgi:uncharacterized protein (TIGR00730 family)